MSADAHGGEPTDEAWDGGWEAHHLAQTQAWAAATPDQRLAWLEAAIAFAHRSGALPGGGTAEDDAQ